MSQQPIEKESKNKDRSWVFPDCSGQHMPPGLYLCATPIGNLGDITVRALEALGRADVVVCEDTRVTGKLLQAYGLKKKMTVYNDHSGAAEREKIIRLIEGGGLAVMVSDAGMPLVSDPGHKLVRDCVARGLYVTSLPGANAVLSAVQLSGIAGGGFTFIGFLPPKAAARRQYLSGLAGVPIPLVFFESPKRVAGMLADVAQVFGAGRVAAVARELTKLHEDVRRGSASELAAFYKDKTVKGEIVVVVEGCGKTAEISDEEIEKLLKKTLAEMKVKDAARFVSEKTGRGVAELYELALRVKDEG